MVERFDVAIKHPCGRGPYAVMVSDADGSYVMASDYAAVRAEYETAMQALVQAQNIIDALQSMLADAERDMRQRAADLCDCACMDGIGDEIRAIGDAILALPLKHADLEGGK